MKRILLAVLFTCLATAASHAQPAPAPGSETLCQGFEETFEGVWRDGSGVEVLLFRYASNPDGAGCYAWLNPVAQWNIAKAGSDTRGKFSRNGEKREWVWPNGRGGVYLDVAAGAARFVNRGRTTHGVFAPR